MLDNIAVCKTCNGNLSVHVKRRIHLASEMQVFCNSCKTTFDFFNTDKLEDTESNVNMYDLNIR